MNRIKELDFIKCIAMIMVVTGHAGVSIIKGMPPVYVGLFFMASGFLVHFDTSFKEFICKNIKRLYLPFVGFHVVFILIHNVWGEGWIYSSVNHYFIVFEHAFLMDVTEPLLSPLWFLTALFFILLVWGAIKRLTAQLNNKNVLSPHCLEMIFIIILFLIGANCSMNERKAVWSMMNPQILNVSLVALLFFEMGHIIRENNYNISKKRMGGGAAFLAILFAKLLILKVNRNFYHTVNVREAAYGNLFLYIIVLLLMWYFLYGVGSFLTKISLCNTIFVLISKETLWIMALHMVVLKVFNILIPSMGGGFGKIIVAICAIFIPVVLHRVWILMTEFGRKIINSRKGFREL